MKTIEQLNRALWAACMGSESQQDSWLLQAEAAIRQGQSIADFVAHTHLSNRRKAKAAYDLAQAECKPAVAPTHAFKAELAHEMGLSIDEL